MPTDTQKINGRSVRDLLRARPKRCRVDLDASDTGRRPAASNGDMQTNGCSPARSTSRIARRTEPPGRLHRLVQGPHGIRTAARFPVAHRACTAHARGDRHLQPFALRGWADRKGGATCISRGRAADITERPYWDAYQKAYATAIGRCSTSAVPWYVIPADRKWHRNWTATHILIEEMEAMKSTYPKPALDIRALKRHLQPAA